MPSRYLHFKFILNNLKFDLDFAIYTCIFISTAVICLTNLCGADFLPYNSTNQGKQNFSHLISIVIVAAVT